jgi:hypothetical protein
MTDTWLDRAACRGTDTRFHWEVRPVKSSADRALAYCEVCPVLEECAQDMADTGEQYRFQVRAGRRMWTSDADTLPDPVVYSWEPPKQQVGGDPGPLSINYIKPSKNTRFNPHTRGPWNTDTPKDNQ